MNRYWAQEALTEIKTRRHKSPMHCKTSPHSTPNSFGDTFSAKRAPFPPSLPVLSSSSLSQGLLSVRPSESDCLLSRTLGTKQQAGMDLQFRQNKEPSAN